MRMKGVFVLAFIVGLVLLLGGMASALTECATLDCFKNAIQDGACGEARFSNMTEVNRPTQLRYYENGVGTTINTILNNTFYIISLGKDSKGDCYIYSYNNLTYADSSHSYESYDYLFDFQEDFELGEYFADLKNINGKLYSIDQLFLDGERGYRYYQNLGDYGISMSYYNSATYGKAKAIYIQNFRNNNLVNAKGNLSVAGDYDATQCRIDTDCGGGVSQHCFNAENCIENSIFLDSAKFPSCGSNYGCSKYACSNCNRDDNNKSCYWGSFALSRQKCVDCSSDDMCKRGFKCSAYQCVALTPSDDGGIFIANHVISFLYPTTAYMDSLQKFKIFIDRDKLNENQPVNYTAVFDIINMSTNNSICGTTSCIFTKDQSAKKAGYNITLIFLNSTTARFEINSTSSLSPYITAGTSKVFTLNSGEEFNLSLKEIKKSWKNEKTIKKYAIYFGNGDTKTSTSSPEIEYKYNDTGNYDVRVNVTDSNNTEYSRTFTIKVESPKNIIEPALANKQGQLNKLLTQINSNFTVAEASLIKIALKLNTINDSIKVVQKAKDNSTTDEQYANILKQIDGIAIPDFVGVSGTSQEDYVPDSAVVSQALNVMATLDASDIQQIVDTYYGWALSNVDVKLNSKEISTQAGENVGKAFDLFELSIVNTGTATTYVVIKDIPEISVPSNYVSYKKSGYYIIPLSTSNQKFLFASTLDLTTNQLPVLVAPDPSALKLEDKIDLGGVQAADTGKSWTTFIVLIILLIVITAGIVVLGIWWYKRRYENYLFKNRNDLYNLVNFVKSTKSSGATNSEIREKLKKAGWTGEQIGYVLGKVK